MEPKSIFLDGGVLWLGIQWASSRTEEPVLCLVKRDTITFVAVSGLRLVASWQYQLEDKVPEGAVFMIPPMIASFLSTEAIQNHLSIEMEDDIVTVVTRDELGRYELRWRSDSSSFNPPQEFNRMLTPPSHLLEVSYLKISDAAHQAVARLAEMESAIHRSKLAILVDFGHGRLRINGKEIESGPSTAYYFDPRLIIRALEFLKADRVKVGIKELPYRDRAILSIIADYEDWLVHCALLSIGIETQKLYPIPPGRNR